MNSPLPAQFSFDAAGFTIKSLAVVGGAVVCGLLVGALAGLLVRVMTTRKLPSKMRWAFRGLGGIIGGWLLALFLFGGGGLGFGGAGGWGFGGTGAGPGDSSTGSPPKDDRPAVKDTGHALSSPTDTLRIEVLGDPALKRMRSSAVIDSTRCYRIDGEEPPRLRTIRELQATLTERLQQQPALKLVQIVLYTDSPARRVQRVDELKQWLDHVRASPVGNQLKVEFREPDEPAPTR
jgi:hypothetical protein